MKVTMHIQLYVRARTQMSICLKALPCAYVPDTCVTISPALETEAAWSLVHDMREGAMFLLHTKAYSAKFARCGRHVYGIVC